MRNAPICNMCMIYISAISHWKLHICIYIYIICIYHLFHLAFPVGFPPKIIPWDRWDLRWPLAQISQGTAASGQWQPHHERSSCLEPWWMGDTDSCQALVNHDSISLLFLETLFKKHKELHRSYRPTVPIMSFLDYWILNPFGASRFTGCHPSIFPVQAENYASEGADVPVQEAKSSLATTALGWPAMSGRELPLWAEVGMVSQSDLSVLA